MSADLVIRNGVVVDGTGAPGAPGRRRHRRRSHRRGGRRPRAATTRSTPRAAVVAPGFIDIHTHYDAQVFWDPALTSSCWHGVTSVIAGNCGFSIAPTRPSTGGAIVRTLQAVEDMSRAHARGRHRLGLRDLRRVPGAGRARAAPILNFGCYVGHSPVRLFVMGDEGYEREATPEEIERMRAVVAERMRAGALGFASSFSANHRGDRGLPVPSRNGTADEFVALASVLGELGAGVGRATRRASR